MTNNFKIGDRVTRDPFNRMEDRALHRCGEIIEINLEAGRARVYWTEEGNGSPVLNSRNTVGVRTWVKLSVLHKA